jgi:hypothetical protein
MNHISSRCERNALRLLQSMCLGAITRYPQTIQEDIELLKKDDEEYNLDYTERNCIIERAGEKRVLHHWLKLIDKIMPIL